MEQINSKILLFGEYAVLHQGMALVIPCDKYHGHFEFYNGAKGKKDAMQSNEFLKKFCEFVKNHSNEQFVLEVQQFEQELREGLFFRSNIPQGYGLGSSGAIVAAIVLRYLKKAKNVKDELKYQTLHKLQELKGNLGELESHFHGVSSGLDPLSIILNEPVLYKNAQEIVTAELPKALVDGKNVVFLLDTKCSRTTSALVTRFNEMYEAEGFKKKFDNYVLEGNNQAIDNFLQNKIEDFYGSLHQISQFQLDEMGEFFPEELRKEMKTGLDNGDYLLKLCGAGGGGFMLGFTQNWEKTQESLKDYTLEPIYIY